MSSKTNKFVLADNVRIFSNGDEEIRIRKGIWNHEEAILCLDDVSENMRKVFTKLFNSFDDGLSMDLELFSVEEQLSPEEIVHLNQILDALKGQGYIHSEDDSIGKHLLSDMIGGAVAGRYFVGTETLKPVLFFADTQSVKSYAQLLAKEINLPITVMTEKEFKDIAAMDLTTRFDGYDVKKQLDELKKFIEPFGCIIGCLERPHVSFLRNINRVLIQTSQVLSLALLDGPFTSVFTIKPPETGCFECYENRLMARLQDIPAYRKFVEHTRKHSSIEKERTFSTPVMHSIASTVLFEGFLVSSIGKAKLSGRVLNTFLPIMEIQVQDLLRVPFCPACGFVSEANMSEMYTSTKKIIDKVINNVVIKND